MNEERLEILKMIEEGKLTADEAAKLLEAMGREGEAGASGTRGRTARWLRIRVSEGKGGERRNRVNVNVPIRLLDVVKHFIPKGSLNINGTPVDLNDIVALIKEGAEGKLVEVDGEDGEHVEIFVE